MAEQIPYTYLIGWKEHSKYYYGVRYAKKCNPEEFWKSYFTSSHYVHKFAKLHGNPDIIQIRKTFQSPISAIKWERKVLSRMKVLHREDFLNANVAGSFIFTEEILNKMRETKKNNINKHIGMSGKMWITNGALSRVISKEDLLPAGWVIGRKVPKLLGRTFSYTKAPTDKNTPTFWITNGKNNMRISAKDIIPEGWNKGHSVRNKESIKGSHNTIWITNTVENRKIRKTEDIPMGWKRGRVNAFPGKWDDK